MHPIAVLFAAVALAGAAPAAAQDARVYVPTGEGGRYVKLLDPKVRVAGYGAPAVAAFRGTMGQVIAQLDAMREVNSPPPGICHQLNSWIEIGGALDAKVLSASVEVMRPLEYLNGRCIKTNNGLVMLGLNRTSDLVGPRERHLEGAEGRDGRNWYVLPLDRVGPNRIELVRGGHRVVALTRAGTPLFVPVSAERYAAEQVRRGRASAAEASARAAGGRITQADIERFQREERPQRIAEFEAGLRDVSLPPAKLAQMRRAHAEGLDLAEGSLRQQLRQQQEAEDGGAPADPQQDYWLRTLAQVRGSTRPACLVYGGGITTLDLSEACRPEHVVMEFNPAYYDTARPGDLQLLTLVTPLRGDGLSEPSRQAIWRALDVGRLASLVR